METNTETANLGERCKEGLSRIEEAVISIGAALSRVTDSMRLVAQRAVALAANISINAWAVVHHPRLYHLTHYSKSKRVRKKNAERIRKLYEQR